jgi:hypothetical protein
MGHLADLREDPLAGQDVLAVMADTALAVAAHTLACHNSVQSIVTSVRQQRKQLPSHRSDQTQFASFRWVVLKKSDAT